jgi:hypothetical protein
MLPKRHGSSRVHFISKNSRELKQGAGVRPSTMATTPTRGFCNGRDDIGADDMIAPCNSDSRESDKADFAVTEPQVWG